MRFSYSNFTGIPLFCLLVCGPAVAPSQLRAQDDIITRTIEIFGNNTFSESLLKQQMTLKEKGWLRRLQFWNRNNALYVFSENLLERDLESLVQFYRTEGFLNARIDTFYTEIDENGESARVVIRVFEGDSVTVHKLDYVLRAETEFDRQRCTEVISRLRPWLQLKQGQRYRDLALQADFDLLHRRIANAGYPYVRISPQPVLNRERTQLDLTLIIEPGPFTAFGEITIEGNQRVPDEEILKQLSFKTGLTFNRENVEKSQAQIYQLGLFQFVTIQLLFADSADGRLPVHIRVREAPTYTVRFGFGYGKEEKVRVSTDTQLLGLGGARRLTILARRSALEPFNISLALAQPALPDRLSILRISPFFRRQKETAFDVQRAGINVSLQRKMGHYTSGFVNYTLEHVRDERASAGPKTSSKSALSFGMSRDNYAPLLSPVRGTSRSGTITVSGLGFGSVKFLRFVGEHIKYWGLGERTVFAHKVKIGVMKSMEPDDFIPREERFYAGGSYSVRGWNRQELGAVGADGKPTGGNLMLEASLELRYPLWGSFSGVTFLDFGNVWTDRISGMHYALGFGLRFDTVIGPVRLDIGIPMLETSRFLDRKDAKLHLSVGHAF